MVCPFLAILYMSGLIFVAQLPPPFHGASACNNVSLNILRKNNYRVKVVPYNFSEDLADLRKLNIKKLYRMIRALLAVLVAGFSNEKFVYFSISPTGLAFYRDALFSFVFKCFGKKIIFHLHGKGLQHSTGLKRFIAKAVFRSTYVISLSRKLKSDVSDFVSPILHFTCMNGAIDCFLDKESKGEAVLKLLFFSNLRKSKGVDVYLNICRLLSEAGVVFKAYVAGPFTPDFTRDDFVDFMRNNPMLSNCVSYLGALDQDRKKEVLTNADILIHPTRNDAFPLVILEALSAECVVLASPEGGIPDILKGMDFGAVIDVDDMASWVEAVLQYSDFSLLKAAQKKARLYYENGFTFDHYESGFLSILNEIGVSK